MSQIYGYMSSVFLLELLASNFQQSCIVIICAVSYCTVSTACSTFSPLPAILANNPGAPPDASLDCHMNDHYPLPCVHCLYRLFKGEILADKIMLHIYFRNYVQHEKK